MSAGARFRGALEAERPLQIVGTINAYTALLAERAGFRAIYLSGAGVANASFGLPGPRDDDPERRLRGRAPHRVAPPTCRCSSMPTPAGAARS